MSLSKITKNVFIGLLVSLGVVVVANADYQPDSSTWEWSYECDAHPNVTPGVMTGSYLTSPQDFPNGDDGSISVVDGTYLRSYYDLNGGDDGWVTFSTEYYVGSWSSTEAGNGVAVEFGVRYTTADIGEVRYYAHLDPIGSNPENRTWGQFGMLSVINDTSWMGLPADEAYVVPATGRLLPYEDWQTASIVDGLDHTIQIVFNSIEVAGVELGLIEYYIDGSLLDAVTTGLPAEDAPIYVAVSGGGRGTASGTGTWDTNYVRITDDAPSAGAVEFLYGDANGDGVVSAGDYAAVQAGFGNTLGGTATADVPEPATMCALGFGALALIRRRR